MSRSEPYLKRKREAERLARQMKEMAEADAYVQELIAKGVFSKHPKDMTGEELKVAAERYEAHERERKGPCLSGYRPTGPPLVCRQKERFRCRTPAWLLPVPPRRHCPSGRSG